MRRASEIDSPEPDYRNDGSSELSPRETIRLLIDEPAIRNYAFAAFGSLAMIALMLLQQGSDVGAILIVITGISGVLFRFTAAPVFVILLLTYFMWTPLGIPGEGYSFSSMIEMRRFHFIDVILVLSVLVYVISQYRIYGLVSQAIAFDTGIRRKDEPTTRRPAKLIRPSELSKMLGLSVVLVIVGQLIWLFATSVQVATAEEFPLRMAESRTSPMRSQGQGGKREGASVYLDPRMLEDERFHEHGVLSRGVSRFFVLVGMLFFGTLITTLVFRYWRLRTLEPAEASMILLDAGWGETHRERVRLEKWRIWGRKRAEASTQENEKSRGKP
jgi:hypothetical protein